MLSIFRSLSKDWKLLRLPELSGRDKRSLIRAKYFFLTADVLGLPLQKRFRLRGNDYFFTNPMDPAFLISVLLEVRASLHMLGLVGERELVLVDVGAHNGETALAWSIFLTEPTIYSFEPHPGAYRNAVRNLDGLRVNLHNLGLGDAPGELPFDLSDRSAGTTTFALEGRTPVDCMLLPVVRGDDVLPHDADVVKIDVEGFEYHVLSGMREVLKQCRALLLELSLGRNKDYTFSEMARLLSDLGLELVGTSSPHQTSRAAPPTAIDLYMWRVVR